MAKVKCISTCYMPNTDPNDEAKMIRYEDDPTNTGEGVYEIPKERVKEFLDSGNFIKA